MVGIHPKITSRCLVGSVHAANEIRVEGSTMIWSDGEVHQRIDATQADLGYLRDCIALIASVLGATNALGKAYYAASADPYKNINIWEYIPQSLRIKYALQALAAEQSTVQQMKVKVDKINWKLSGRKKPEVCAVMPWGDREAIHQQGYDAGWEARRATEAARLALARDSSRKL